jgi:hypothetical protein
VGLLDTGAEEPKSKALRLAITAVALLIGVSFLVWYLLRFQAEKEAAGRFFQALAAGDTKRAYELWQPNPNYSYELFLEDWGPEGEFGPVRSYRVVAAARPKNASGVVVVVEVSAKAPFEGGDPSVKEIKIWVERKDKSLGFAPL